MNDANYAMIAREAGGGGGRTRGPRCRPSYTAHPARWWSQETRGEHLAACRSGRDGSGSWKPWEALTEAERWSWWWESAAAAGFGIASADTEQVTVP